MSSPFAFVPSFEFEEGGANIHPHHTMDAPKIQPWKQAVRIEPNTKGPVMISVIAAEMKYEFGDQTKLGGH